MLWFIGLGLGDEQDITVRGLEVVKKCARVFLEAYTAVLSVGQDRLEKFYGRPLILADRTMVEQKSDIILQGADKEDVAFLVVGDALAATTHHDLMLRAVEKGIAFKVIHNASIMNACAASGLQLYHFGQTVSIPYFDGEWRPQSFYEKIATNKQAQFHTLCLLDIKVKEQSKENLAKGVEKYEPPRFMTINEAIKQLLEVESERKLGICAEDALAIGMARVGQNDQAIVSGTLGELSKVDFGGPLHSLVLPGPALHEIEKRMFSFYHWDRANVEKKLADEAHNEEQNRMAALEKERALRRQQEAERVERIKREKEAAAAALAAKRAQRTQQRKHDSSDSDSSSDSEADKPAAAAAAGSKPETTEKK